MKFKYLLIALVAFLLGREVLGLYQHFVVDGKTWADLKAMTVGDAKAQLKKELKHPVAEYKRAFGKGV